MCAIALALMVGETLVMLWLGYGMTEAAIWGLVVGPGWLAVVTIGALVLRFFHIE